ncbi:hypothetical protein HG531_009218 [Fusarium graminearum]|nr:hypothetical protein HG531_009218 [Fusarium graminearum]
MIRVSGIIGYTSPVLTLNAVLPLRQHSHNFNTLLNVWRRTLRLFNATAQTIFHSLDLVSKDIHLTRDNNLLRLTIISLDLNDVVTWKGEPGSGVSDMDGLFINNVTDSMRLTCCKSIFSKGCLYDELEERHRIATKVVDGSHVIRVDYLGDIHGVMTRNTSNRTNTVLKKQLLHLLHDGALFVATKDSGDSRVLATEDGLGDEIGDKARAKHAPT